MTQFQAQRGRGNLWINAPSAGDRGSMVGPPPPYSADNFSGPKPGYGRGRGPNRNRQSAIELENTQARMNRNTLWMQ